MKNAAVALILMLAVAGVTINGQIAPKPRFGVKVTTAPKIDFARFATYSWFEGRSAFDPAAHKRIVAAIDRELASLGLKQVPDGGDVDVVYHTLRSTAVDVQKARPKDGVEKEVQVGTLVVNLQDPATGEQLWHARIDTPIALEAATIDQTITDAVAALFQQYPTRTKR